MYFHRVKINSLSALMKMTLRKAHYLSGLVLTAFIGLHLFNHVCSIFGAARHIEIMNTLRVFYRHIVIEIILMIAVALQIISGLKLFNHARKFAITIFEKIHIGTGLYLSLFLVIHLSAILIGRFILQLDTNFYFGVAGLNSFPHNLFFIPYYGFAIISFFGHIASIHHKKMKQTIFGCSPTQQSIGILILGTVITMVIFYGLTNHFTGVIVPKEFEVLIGK